MSVESGSGAEKSGVPRWQQLHDAWWDELRRVPQPGDLEAAWGMLIDVLPTGWTIARPTHDPVLGHSNASAVLVTGKSRIGHMPKVVCAQAPSEPTVLVELARCLVVTGRGVVPQ